MSGQDVREMEGSSWDFRRVCTGGEGGKGGFGQGQGRLCRVGLGSLSCLRGPAQGSSGRKLWKSKDGAGKLLAVAMTCYWRQRPPYHQGAEPGAYRRQGRASVRSADWDEVGAARSDGVAGSAAWVCLGRHWCPRPCVQLELRAEDRLCLWSAKQTR